MPSRLQLAYQAVRGDNCPQIFNFDFKRYRDTFNYGNESVAPSYVFSSVVLGNASHVLLARMLQESQLTRLTTSPRLTCDSFKS
jgi:hypothetical protein